TRTRRALALAALLASSATLLAAAPAQADQGQAHPPVTTAAATTGAVEGDGAAAGRTYDLVNAARAAAGLAPLRLSPDTTAVATDWAFHLASTGTLAHNADLARRLTGWSLVAENVGVGASAEELQDAFWGSPGHRANELRENVTQLGVGAVRSADGRLWVVQVYKLPAGEVAPPRGAPAPVPAPAPAPAPAPDPVARPAAAFAPAPVLPRRARAVAPD
ncbi:hypothetical protein GTR02_19550, partial [Kineococcus sp. R8]|uniref:CAP domain-containing protein n=1 Tax=Kineococcus siccus TaxID=2696567 RepID=UPI0014123B85